MPGNILADEGGIVPDRKPFSVVASEYKWSTSMPNNFLLRVVDSIGSVFITK